MLHTRCVEAAISVVAEAAANSSAARCIWKREQKKCGVPGLIKLSRAPGPSGAPHALPSGHSPPHPLPSWCPGGVAACCRPIGLCPRAAAWPEGGGARRRMRPHTDAGFGALSGERGAYLPAERPSAASSAARLAATQQQRCRASTAPASQRRPRHPPSRARQGATVDARRLKAATCLVRRASSS